MLDDMEMVMVNHKCGGRVRVIDFLCVVANRQWN